MPLLLYDTLKTGIDDAEVSLAVIFRDALDVQNVIVDPGIAEPPRLRQRKSLGD